jgi:uncharacterized MAPEG superfamily protein
MIVIEPTSDHGYAIVVLVALWLQQQLLFAMKVSLARRKFGIQPPTLYPRDSEIKTKNLTDAQVSEYMCVQRVHQNNVEFLSVYFPVMIIAMLGYPMQTAHAGAVVWIGRMATALGYWRGAEKRIIGGFFHFGEFYTVYLAAKFAYELITHEKD